MRSWAVPKGPSMDPAVKRLAVEVHDHEIGDSPFEGRPGDGGVIVWDRGPYEQGGRVAWPEALERGHAVFVLHGEKLAGGFALQRTGAAPRPQWLLVKRRDEDARPGSDIVAEQPRSVLSARTLEEVLGGRRRSAPGRRARGGPRSSGSGRPPSPAGAGGSRSPSRIAPGTRTVNHSAIAPIPGPVELGEHGRRAEFVMVGVGGDVVDRVPSATARARSAPPPRRNGPAARPR